MDGKLVGERRVREWENWIKLREFELPWSNEDKLFRAQKSLLLFLNGTETQEKLLVYSLTLFKTLVELPVKLIYILNYRLQEHLVLWAQNTVSSGYR